MLRQRRQWWTHAVCVERGWVCTQFNAQHVATGCTGDVQECEEVWREWHRVLCAKYVELEEKRQLMSFTLKMSS